jgi:hypothetical protein
MKYEQLKDGKKVNVYIPSMNRFYRMDVTSREYGDDGLGGFSISNYDTGKRNRIDGHEYLGIVRNQKDVDAFFYMQKESVTGREGDLSFDKAEEHFKKNKRSWIFKSIK